MPATRRSTAALPWTLLALVLAVPLLGLPPASPAPATAQPGDAPGPAHVEVHVIGNRADLLSGGDALVEVRVPADADPGDLTVDVGGRDVTGAFAVRDAGRYDGRFLGLVEDIAVGEHALTATLPDGRGATLRLTMHPAGGPVFSGPQIQPWTCTNGSDDPQCAAPVTYEFLYKPLVGTGLQPYDPASPPSQPIATTTTDEGVEVPFIVRLEQGVLNRDNYQIAVLFDPDQAWEPTAPQPQFNHKLLITHGASCDTHYQMADPPSVFTDTIGVPGFEDVVPNAPIEALGRGFAVMSHALNNSGHNCNVVVQAEAMIMTKERVAERYGELRYTIGSGCSGGALAQYWTANAYPGLYDGITASCSFPDAGSSAMQYIDYVLLRDYFEDPTRWGVPWEAVTIGQVYGHPNPANAATFTEAIPNSGDPSRPCVGIPDEDVYDADANPDGVRCTLQEYNVNALGRRDGDGFANRPFSNVGLQYGLEGLLAGTLLPAQFVDLNLKAGGFDIDLERTEARYAADMPAVERLYRSGLNNTASNLDGVAIIDFRGPDPGLFHDTYRTYALQERLVREHGHADNMVLWRGTVPLIGDIDYFRQALIAMDDWLARVEADPSDRPLAERIVANKPAEIEDRCTTGTGVDVPSATCDLLVDVYATPRIAAGAPTTDDQMVCQLIPIEEFDYQGRLTDAQITQLAEAFPTGVCDHTRPGLGEVDTVPWLDYSEAVGGVPLGEAPASVPFGPGAPGGPGGPGGVAVERLAGEERIGTAVAVSQARYDTADAVVVATAGDFADALAGGPLAVALDAPLLLTGPDGLAAATAAEVQRLGARSALLLGGEAALAPAVAEALEESGVAVERVAGPDRFATAGAIADRLAEEVGPAGEVVLAAGGAFPDALSASALAAAEGMPILLTTTDDLHPEAAARLGADVDVLVVGGTAVVSDEAAATAEEAAGAVARLAGDTRYGTNAAVVAEGLDRGLDPSTVWLATGADFPDGLVAGAGAGAERAPLVLVDGRSPAGSPESLALLAGLAGRVEGLTVAGGTAAVADAVVEAVVAALRPG